MVFLVLKSNDAPMRKKIEITAIRIFLGVRYERISNPEPEGL